MHMHAHARVCMHLHAHACRWMECMEWVLSGYAYAHICMQMHFMWMHMHAYACRVSLGGVVDVHMHADVCIWTMICMSDVP